MTIRQWGFLIVIVAAGALLRFYGIGAKSLWHDETLSWQLHRFPLKEIIARTGEPYTTHPPAYFILLRLWAGIWGDSEVSLRSLAAVAGLLTIVGAFVVTVELQSFPHPGAVNGAASTPLLAACLVALSVLQIHASQQVRHYSIGTVLLLGVWISMLRALRAGSAIWWLFAAVLGLMFCYVHHLALFHLAALYLFAAGYLIVELWRLRANKAVPPQNQAALWQQLPWALISVLVIVVGYSPWLAAMMGQVHAASQPGQWRPTVKAVAEPTYYALTSSFAQRPPTPLWWSAAISLFLLVALVVLAIWCGWPGKLLCIVGLVPPLLLLAQSWDGSRVFYVVRLLTFTQVTWLIAVAYLVGRIPDPLHRQVAAGLCVASAALLCAENWSTIGPTGQPGMRAAMAHIATLRASDEPVLTQSSFGIFGANYYSRGQFPVLLCGPERNRFIYPNAAHLRQEEIMTVAEAGQLKSGGVWLVNTLTLAPMKQMDLLIPAHWRLESSTQFDRGDYHWESPIKVDYYIIEKELNR